MSKFWIYFKTEVKTTFKQIPQTVGVYLLLPFFFSVLLGFSFMTAFTPEVTIEPIDIHVTNNDEGEVGQMLTDILETDELGEYFALTTEDEADFLVTIQPNYSAQIADTQLTIESKPNTSSTDQSILNSFLVDWQQTLVNQEELLGEMANVSNPETVATLQAELTEISGIQMEQVFVNETFESDKALTSKQFTSVAGLIYLFFLTLSTSVTLSTNKDFKGLKKRLGILPLTPAQSVLYELATNTIVYGVIASLFIIMWRVYDPNTFSGNPLVYGGWILIYTLFFQAVNSVLMYLVPEKLTAIFYQSFLMFYMIFGFLPIDKIAGGRIAELFSQNTTRKIFNQPFYDYMLSHNFLGNANIALGLIGVTTLLVGLTIIIRNRKEMA